MNYKQVITLTLSVINRVQQTMQTDNICVPMFAHFLNVYHQHWRWAEFGLEICGPVCI